MNSISERARRFHRDHPIADLLALNLSHPRFTIADIDLGRRDESSCRGDFPKFRDWGLKVAMCKGGAAVPEMNFAPKWLEDPTFRPGRPDSEPMYLSMAINSPTLLCLAVLDRFLCNVEENPDKVILVRTAADLDRALSDPGRIAVLMGANRSDWFGDSPGALRQFARLGLRMVTIGQATRELGWDVSGELRSGGRMTALGVRMIEEMNRRGILIDLAHTNDPCALDAIEVSERPVIDTHSGPRALEEDPSPRSTSDEVMKGPGPEGGPPRHHAAHRPSPRRRPVRVDRRRRDGGYPEAGPLRRRPDGSRPRRHRHALQFGGPALDHRGAARGRLFREGHGEDHGGQLPAGASGGAAGVRVHGSVKRDWRAEEFRCLVALGESTTAGGWSTSPERCWVAVLGGLINDFQERPARVVNSGIGANVISTRSPCYDASGKPAASERLEKHVLAHDPDLLVISYGLNDARGGTPLPQFREDLALLVERVRGHGDPLIVLPGPYFMTDFTVGGRDWSHADLPLFRSFNAATAELAAELGCLHVDLLEASGEAPWTVHPRRGAPERPRPPPGGQPHLRGPGAELLLPGEEDPGGGAAQPEVAGRVDPAVRLRALRARCTESWSPSACRRSPPSIRWRPGTSTSTSAGGRTCSPATAASSPT